jgi:hypothetical protein
MRVCFRSTRVRRGKGMSITWKYYKIGLKNNTEPQNNHRGRTGVTRENNNKERLPLRTTGKATKYHKNMYSNTLNKNTGQNCKNKNIRPQLYCLLPFLKYALRNDNKYRWKHVVICKYIENKRLLLLGLKKT